MATVSVYIGEMPYLMGCKWDFSHFSCCMQMQMVPINSLYAIS